MATKRKDGRYQAAYRCPATGKKMFAYGKTEEEAESKKRLLLLEAANEAGLTPSIELDLHTLAGLLWFPEVDATTRNNSMRRYRVAYKNHVQPKWGHRTVDSIKASEVQAWVNSMNNNKIPPASITLYRGILSTILRRCVREGLIQVNYASFAKVPKIRERRRVMTIDQARDLLAKLDGTKLGAPVYMAVVLGMRRGEICGLKWSKVDQKTRRIVIDEQILVQHGKKRGKGVTTAPTKTESSERTFVLPEALFNPLLKLGDLDSDYVCTQRNHKHWNPEHLTYEWAAVRKSLGFEGWHFHDLRHVAASMQASLGVDLLSISSILGQKKVDTTMLYAHAQESTATAALEAFGTVFFPVD